MAADYAAQLAIPRTVQMGAADQVRSFVAWMLDTELTPARLTDKRVVTNYYRWAEEWNVVPIPPSILLNLLKRHPQVRKSRDRILDARGVAARNANGTPIRPYFYTFAKKHAAPRKRPGTVPVTDMVQPVPLLARPRFGKELAPMAAEAPGAVAEWATEASKKERIAA